MEIKWGGKSTTDGPGHTETGEGPYPCQQGKCRSIRYFSNCFPSEWEEIKMVPIEKPGSDETRGHAMDRMWNHYSISSLMWCVHASMDSWVGIDGSENYAMEVGANQTNGAQRSCRMAQVLCAMRVVRYAIAYDVWGLLASHLMIETTERDDKIENKDPSQSISEQAIPISIARSWINSIPHFILWNIYWFGFYFVNMFVLRSQRMQQPTSHVRGYVLTVGRTVVTWRRKESERDRCLAVHTFSYGCSFTSHIHKRTHKYLWYSAKISIGNTCWFISFDGWVASVLPRSFRTNISIGCAHWHCSQPKWWFPDPLVASCLSLCLMLYTLSYARWMEIISIK